ncbi:MAG: spore protein [Paenibacillus sp.]|uniref:Uncharacterized protein n=1 Tax=Paenibacillus aquistagni TaxID=1852522 RepID=A0A1X7LCY3_9BACL|nr:spore protein [Paenibacillus aquistagni]MBR2568841.1 spore protein [Paenibacillus sp.]SMG51334.1 hypothetical protein SAMN06295960_3247 [Paenibacillus aquistagni]
MSNNKSKEQEMQEKANRGLKNASSMPDKKLDGPNRPSV